MNITPEDGPLRTARLPAVGDAAEIYEGYTPGAHVVRIDSGPREGAFLVREF